MKKKKIAIILLVIILIAAFFVGAFFFWKKNKKETTDEVCYVESVSVICGNGVTWENRYMGIVESQEVTQVQKDSDKTVKEIFVKEEDVVKAGDKLFEYDTEEMTLKLRQMELELSSIYNNVSTMNDQITTLVAERELAPAENKIEYTSQIQNLQAQINQASYDASAKQLEIDRQNSAIRNAIVYAPVDGVISQINNQEDSGESYSYDYYGTEGNNNSGFISIMAMGDYRIKGTVSELNAYSLYEGMPVILRSRVDENIMWTGSISTIDLEHPESNDNMYYYGTGETATKYPFYVDLDSSDGLMLGQHLYIELDYGQGMSKDGMWLYESYIMLEGDKAYVWVENGSSKLERRQVTLGEYDAEMLEYEIVSGLSESDYIAFPEDRLYEGMSTTHNYEDVMTYDNLSDDVYEGEINEDIYIEDGAYEEYPEEGMIIEEDISVEEDIEEGSEDLTGEDASGEEAY